MGAFVRMLEHLGGLKGPDVGEAAIDLARILSSSINVMNLRGLSVDELVKHIEQGGTAPHEEKYAAGRD